MIDQATDCVSLHDRILNTAELLGYPYIAYAYLGGLRGIPGSAIAWQNTCRRLKASEPEQVAVLDALTNKALEMGKEIDEMILKKSDYELLETGDYVASVANYETAPQTNPEYGPSIKVEFDVETDDGYKKLSCFVPTKSFGPKSKMAQLVLAALACTWEDIPESFNLDDIIAQRMIITIVSKPKDDGTEYNKIERFKPRKKQTAAAPKAAPKANAFDDD